MIWYALFVAFVLFYVFCVYRIQWVFGREPWGFIDVSITPVYLKGKDMADEVKFPLIQDSDGDQLIPQNRQLICRVRVTSNGVVVPRAEWDSVDIEIEQEGEFVLAEEVGVEDDTGAMLLGISPSSEVGHADVRVTVTARGDVHVSYISVESTTARVILSTIEPLYLRAI